jgi:hypothetical protein
LWIFLKVFKNIDKTRGNKRLPHYYIKQKKQRTRKRKEKEKERRKKRKGGRRGREKGKSKRERGLKVKESLHALPPIER